MDGVGAEAYTGRRADSTPQTAGLMSPPKSPSLGRSMAPSVRPEVLVTEAAAAMTVTAANFMTDVVEASGVTPVLMDFWAPWCGPCRMVAPELARVAADNKGRYLILKVNTDAIPELGERFGIRSIPTMAVFDGGKERGRTAGARPAADIESFIGSTLAP